MPGRRGGLSVISVVAAGGVPASRVINGTSPIRVNGGASADLSADVTLSILPATTSQAGFMSAAQVASLMQADPLAGTWPSWGTLRGLVGGPGACDFLTGQATSPFAVTALGTSANVGSTVPNGANRIGASAPSTGTDTTGRCAIFSANTIRFANGQVRFRSDVRVPTLSNGTETFTSYVGFADDTIVTDSSNAAYFRLVDSVNGGRWQCVTRASSVETATDSGVSPSTGAEQGLEIEVNAAGTSVRFAINGNVVATHTTNIPTAAIGTVVGVRKSAGTTARTIAADLKAVRLDRTAAI